MLHSIIKVSYLNVTYFIILKVHDGLKIHFMFIPSIPARVPITKAMTSLNKSKS